MDQEKKSRGEQVIEQLMAQLDPQSERYRVLAVARRFKSTWVELGEQLLKVSRQELFRSWGYDTFADYCAKEVRVRRPTAEKLTLAYRYLEQEEPQLLARSTELKPLPDYRSVDLLRQAREEQHLPPEQYAELRKAVIDDERSHPTVLKRFREAAATQRPAEEEERQALQGALAAARRLSVALKALPELPSEHADPVVHLITLLEERLKAGEEG